jgi:21S rRNA (GM2251-2'-O)-methyltransferase
MALKARERKIYELITQEGMDLENKKDDKAALEILNLAKERNIKQRELTKHDMNMLTDSRPHQGFILKSSKIEFQQVKSMPVESEFK